MEEQKFVVEEETEMTWDEKNQEFVQEDSSTDPQLQEYLQNMFLKKSTLVRVHKTGRNEPCVCGSGIKYKKCCIRKEEKYKVQYNYGFNEE